MPNPLCGLRPALEVIAQEVEILPATGQALEDLMRTDQEEAYGRVGPGRMMRSLMCRWNLRVLEDNP